MLMSQKGLRISIKAFPEHFPEPVIECYDLAPEEAARNEAEIARVMHRHEGLNGRLPASVWPDDRADRLRNSILRYFERHYSGCVAQIAGTTGYTTAAIYVALCEMEMEGKVFQGPQRGTKARIWRATASAPKAKPKPSRYGGETNLQAVEAYLSKPGEHTRNDIAAATGATQKNVGRALQHLRKLGRAEFRRVGKLGETAGCSTLWRLK